jgi:hypothetical protein
MTTTIEHAEILERTIKYKYNEADEFCTQSLHIKPTEIQCKEAAQRLRELDKLVKAVHSAKGRHHSQIAMCDLYEACGLPFQRPNCGRVAKDAT